ncbi:hypothetical protein HCN44_003175 [Aphidius gifuensis]|uniref:RBD domain-containing protein n=3 Tax=Aphidius gifuensis TaxID=684658 RepID=A0A834XJQ7_APHGI|nr:hypothetical protein HCN44_003175 [Aphidius gifuensis]
MVLTVTEDTPADMLTGSMELLVLLPREHQIHTQKVTVERSTAMMDLLVQISTSHKLAASSYTLQAIGERGLVLPHQPNTPIGALDALQVKLLPKQGTFIPHKMKQANQPFETTFRLQVHLPRNQLYVSRVSPKMNLGEILEEVCREKNLDRNKYELRHPGNHEEKLDLSLSLEDYHLQEVTLYAKQGEKKLGSALSSQDIMALQRQEERRRHQAKQSVFGFMFRSKTKDNSLSNDSIGGRSISPARSDETGRSISPLALPPPTRPQRKRRQAPLPPTTTATTTTTTTTSTTSSIKQQDNIIQDNTKLVINHSRNSSDSSGYHEASVLSDHPDSTGRMPETLPRRSKPPGKTDVRKLGQTSLSSKSMSNLAMTTGGLSHSTSTTSISSTGIRKKRAAPAPPPINRPLSSAISTQALERIDDSEESLTSDIEISKPSSDIAVSSGNENDFNTKIKLHSTPIDKLDNYCSNNNKNINNKMKINTLVDDNVKSSSNNHDACHINVDTACFDKKDNRPVARPRSIALPKIKMRKLIPAMSSTSLSSSSTDVLNLPIDIGKSMNNENKNINENNDSSLIEENKNTSNLSNDEKVNNNFNDEKIIVVKSAEKLTLNDYNNSENNDKSNVELNKNTSTIINNSSDDLILSNTRDFKCDENIDKADSISSNKYLFNSSDNQNVNKNDENNDKNIEFINDNCNLDKSNLINIKNNNDNDLECDINIKKPGENIKNSENLLNPLFNKTPINENNLLFLMHDSCVKVGMELTPFTLDNIAVFDELGSQDMVKADKDEQPSKTDILLQKVSTTLATTVVPSANNHDDNDDNLISSSKKSNKTNDVMIDKDKICETSNSTFNSQQDTSDYVSATGEDLSGTDWEYQLPDPPSAFRDNSSPDSYGYDTITLGSVEAFKEPIIIIDKKDEKLKNEVKEIVNEKSEIKSIVLTQNVDKKCHKQTDDMLRKNIIMELETKIENNCLNQNKINDCQSKIDDNKISNISPVDNTLSNFTITTYSKQKNNNIFKSNDDIFKSNDQNNMYNGKLLQNKTATLPTKNYYNKSNNNSNESSGINRTQSVKTTSQNDNIEFRKKVFKNNNEQDAKKNVYRSKSYIVLSNNSKYRDDKIEDVVDDGVVMRSTSFTNLNQDNSNNFNDNNHDDDDRNNSEIKNEKETTSQCQNEISKELQSVQILKSILPQLKNSQKTEDKISQKILEKRITEESESVNENKKNQSSDLKKNKPESDDASKKYRYTGPPTINLGSWSERPSVNVQIKHDNDYNIGQKNIIKNNNTSTGSKTIVNLNTSSNDVEIINYKDTYKNLQPKNNELKNIDLLNKNIYTNKNLINGIFKLRTISDNNNNKIDENIINDDKINKLHNTNDDDDVKIDTRPVNFKELTQTFGKINLRNKTNNNYQQNRHSDYFDNRLKNDSIIKSSELNKLPIKKYTSVVGINTQNTNCELLNNNNNVYNSGTKMRINNSSMTKLNGCVMPVVKGFKNDKDNDESCTSMKIKINNSTGATSSSSSSSSGVATTVSPSPPPPPQPPTMPIITGVTLKNSNTRPKSMPICQDPRDELLDSIRNFGRNNKLKSINAFS